MKKITMEDIAKEVGVSKVTVSKALGDREGVSESLRTKIKEVAAQMGYCKPHGNMSSLATLQVLSVLVSEVFLDQEESFYTDIDRHLNRLAAEHNYTVILSIITQSSEEQLLLPDPTLTKEVQGIIILGQLQDSYLEMVLSNNKPVVCVDFGDHRGLTDVVFTDNFFAMYQATSYLIERGHREIGFVGNIRFTNNIQDRYLGYQKALLEHDLTMNPAYLLEERTDHGEQIDIALPTPLPTAFVCNCDWAAARLLRTLQQHHIRVPEDVSIVGFDDVWHSRVTTPQITTVKVKRYEMAKYTFDLLLSIIQTTETHSSVPRRIPVPTEMIERDSVAWIRKNDES